MKQETRLTEEEERELMDPAFWDGATVETYPGVADPKVGFYVALGLRHLRLLDAAAARSGTNAGQLVQRYVEERLETDAAAIDPKPHARTA